MRKRKRRGKRQTIARRQQRSMRLEQENLEQRGKASSYIESFDYITPGTKVFIICRVTTRTQKHNGNLDDQETDLVKLVTEAGGQIIGMKKHQGNGSNPNWLTKSAELAKQDNAMLLAESTSRFIRHPAFDTDDNNHLQARDGDLKKLRKATLGVTLVTVLQPDATPKEEKKYHQQRGYRQKRNRQNSTCKKHTKQKGHKLEKRLNNQHKVKWMAACGWPKRDLAKVLSLSESTVRKWVRTFFKEKTLRHVKTGNKPQE